MTRTRQLIWKYAPRSGSGYLNRPSLAIQIAPGLIAINDDFRDRVVLVSVRTKRIVWQYGHTNVPGREAAISTRPTGATAHDSRCSTLAHRRCAARGHTGRHA